MNNLHFCVSFFANCLSILYQKLARHAIIDQKQKLIRSSRIQSYATIPGDAPFTEGMVIPSENE